MNTPQCVQKLREWADAREGWFDRQNRSDTYDGANMLRTTANKLERLKRDNDIHRTNGEAMGAANLTLRNEIARLRHENELLRTHPMHIIQHTETGRVLSPQMVCGIGDDLQTVFASETWAGAPMSYKDLTKKARCLEEELRHGNELSLVKDACIRDVTIALGLCHDAGRDTMVRRANNLRSQAELDREKIKELEYSAVYRRCEQMSEEINQLTNKNRELHDIAMQQSGEAQSESNNLATLAEKHQVLLKEVIDHRSLHTYLWNLLGFKEMGYIRCAPESHPFSNAIRLLQEEKRCYDRCITAVKELEKGFGELAGNPAYALLTSLRELKKKLGDLEEKYQIEHDEVEGYHEAWGNICNGLGIPDDSDIGPVLSAISLWKERLGREQTINDESMKKVKDLNNVITELMSQEPIKGLADEKAAHATTSRREQRLIKILDVLGDLIGMPGGYNYDTLAGNLKAQLTNLSELNRTNMQLKSELACIKDSKAVLSKKVEMICKALGLETIEEIAPLYRSMRADSTMLNMIRKDIGNKTGIWSAPSEQVDVLIAAYHGIAGIREAVDCAADTSPTQVVGFTRSRINALRENCEMWKKEGEGFVKKICDLAGVSYIGNEHWMQMLETNIRTWRNIQYEMNIVTRWISETTSFVGSAKKDVRLGFTSHNTKLEDIGQFIVTITNAYRELQNKKPDTDLADRSAKRAWVVASELSNLFYTQRDQIGFYPMPGIADDAATTLERCVHGLLSRYLKARGELQSNKAFLIDLDRTVTNEVQKRGG